MKNLFGNAKPLLSKTNGPPPDAHTIQTKMAADLVEMLKSNATAATSLVIGYTPDGGSGNKFAEMLMVAASAQSIAAHIVGCIKGLIEVAENQELKESLEKQREFFQKQYSFSHKGITSFDPNKMN